jgi:hypothetical protein
VNVCIDKAALLTTNVLTAAFARLMLPATTRRLVVIVAAVPTAIVARGRVSRRSHSADTTLGPRR